jgi:hypothetical protein
MRYGSEGNYLIVMHPMSSDFERLVADINTFELTQHQLSTYEEAKGIGKPSVELAEGYTFNLTDEFDPADFHVIPHVVSYPRQRLANGLVIKFLKYEHTRKEPNLINNYMVRY